MMYVYVLRYEHVVKIGVSNNPEKRAKSFPFMEIVKKQKVKFPFEVEAILLDRFQGENIGGEFLRLTDDQIVELLNSINDIGEDETLIESDMFGDIECYYDSNQYVNATDLIRKILYKHMIFKTDTLNNIIKSSSTVRFIESFEAENGYSPIYKRMGRSGATYVHPFLLHEIVSRLNIAEEKVNSYDFLFHILGIKKAVDDRDAHTP